MLTEQERKEILGAHEEAFNKVFAEKLAPMIGEEAVRVVKREVENLSIQRKLHGADRSGLPASTKKAFAQAVMHAAFGNFTLKANEALIEEQDNRGGYLVSREVADAILRIAASTGTIMNQAQDWTMTKDSLAIPNYTGSFLKGTYVGVDAPGVVTGLTFGQAMLIVKKWQLAFVVGNDLLRDASENLANWLLSLAGEALSNMIDYQGFVGGAQTGDPFVGLLNWPKTTTIDETGTKVSEYLLGGSSTSGSTVFADFATIDDASGMIADMEESLLPGACFVFHRTVWAKIRSKKDGAGNYILPYAGWAQPSPMAEDHPKGGPIKPAGELLGYPVYTNRHMPAVGDAGTVADRGNFTDGASNPVGIFGNFKAMAFGDRGEMRVEQFNSGSFGGKEIALADQRGIVYRHSHALTNALPRGFVVAYTSAS